MHLRFKLIRTSETYGIGMYMERDDMDTLYEGFSKPEAIAILQTYTGKRKKVRAAKKDKFSRFINRQDAKKKKRLDAIAKAEQDASPFEPEEEFFIAGHYLSALINGDYSSFDYYNETEEEAAKEIKEFDDWVAGVQNGRTGHWSTDNASEGEGEWRRCEVTGLRATCEMVTFFPLKNKAA